jgi:hypothetical protein
MADTSGVDNLNSNSNGSVSLAGIQSAVDNLNTAKQEKGSGVTGNIAAFGSSNVLQDTGKTVPTGTIVGTSDTQTLTSKTLTSPTVTNPSTTGTDSGSQTLLNKIINAALNTISNITEAMLSLSDVTTGNVSTSAHGFAPKAPNDATKYLDGTGNYSKPSSLAFACGVATQASSGTQNIAHGLGRTPQFIRITVLEASNGSSSGLGSHSVGSYNGTTVSSVYMSLNVDGSSTGGVGANTDSTYIAHAYDANTGNGIRAVPSLSSSNITLTWTVIGSPSGTAQIMWEAMG